MLPWPTPPPSIPAFQTPSLPAKSAARLSPAQARAAQAAGRGERLLEFLDQCSLVSDQDELKDAPVTLMTVHASKGLEFPLVFVVGMEQQIFPHSRSHGEPAGIEEERRLFYVAITRAMKKL